MPQFTHEENKRLAFLKALTFIPGKEVEAEKEMQQIYHEAERREELAIQQKTLEENKNANKLSKIAIIISIASGIISTTISILALCL